MSEFDAVRIKAAFLCDRLGPYHLARLNAAHQLMEMTAIEFSLLDQTYAWDLCCDDARFSRITLFRDKPIGMQSRSSVVSRVRTVLEVLRPDVVVVSGWDAPAALAALAWCQETNTPTVLMSESQQQDEQRVWWKEAIKGRIVRLHDAGFVGGTQHKAYLKLLGMPEERIFTGCDAVDNAYFTSGAEAARHNPGALRQKYVLPERYFLVSSRFVQKKNLATLLRAYAAYLKNAGNEPWKLVMLGDGPLKEQILNQREELGLSDMVILPGFAQYPDLPVYYGLAGAFVLASTSEQWGLVVNEAMASGLPVIVSTKCGCAADLVINGRNGFTFDPYDVDALSGHLCQVASQSCLRDEMGAASLEIISECTPDIFARNLKNAVDVALHSQSIHTGFINRIVLEALIRK